MPPLKSQDFLVLLKLVSLARQEASPDVVLQSAQGIPDDWRGWADAPTYDRSMPNNEDWTVRGLEESIGISKTQVGQSLRRCSDVGLTRADRRTGRLRANSRALRGIIVHAFKYVFPASRGPLVRGIPTTYAAPVLAGKLLSGAEYPDVWEDGQGTTLGQSVEPLHRTVPYAVRRDPDLYAMLALVDAIRLGRERESALATKLLDTYLLEAG